MYNRLVMGRVEKLKSANVSQYLTVEEASETLGVKPSVLRNYLYQDKFTTYKFKTLTLVSRSEIKSWADRRR